MEPKRNFVERTGTLTGHEIAMDIDPAMTAHIMSVLTDLYSDSELAVIRELSTNARDSHIEAGQTRPIEVMLPNNMNPYLIIRDFGTGLSVDEVEQIYSKYGASTKRDSNDFNGMLGLGSKSPLTYTNQFMITARKNGVQIILSVSRLEDGRGGMTVIDTSSTKEPNGVEIQIPVKRGHDFARKAAEFFAYWEQGTVLVDGKQPRRFSETENTEELGDGIFMVPGGSDKIVMGNVPYPALKSLWPGDGFYRQFGIVAFVKMGDVDFVPNREALRDKDPDTVAKHDEIRQYVQTSINKKIQKAINECKTHVDVVKKVYEYVGIFRGTNIDMRSFTYKGAKIPGKFERTVTRKRNDGTDYQHSLGFRTFHPSYSRSNTGWSDTITNNPHAFNSTVIVTNMPNDDKPTSTQRAKLRRWAEENGKVGWSFLLVSSDFGGEWTKHVERIDYLAVIKPIKLNDSPNGGPRKGKYDRLIAPYGYGEETSDLDASKPIIFFSSAESIYTRDVWNAFGKTCEIVVLSANRWDKFRRDWPTAQHVNDYIKSQIQSAMDALSEEDKIRLGCDGYEVSTLRAFAPGEILDPAVDKYVTALSKPATQAQKNLGALREVIRSVRLRISTDVSVPKVLTDYPLLGYSRVSGREKDHAVKYVNMIYKENNNGKS